MDITQLKKVYKPIELERIINKAGWYHTYTNGSHYYYEHEKLHGKITIPFHKGKDIDKITAREILISAGIITKKSI